jgi:two-component system C4-dicarboxylate transport sensor histidine kinase DctB
VPEFVPDSGARLEQITDVLVRVAGGDFSARASRSHDGDPWDVLAFLVNATAEEVAFLVEQLREERRHLEEARSQLLQAEKLAALGELAGGVAHELNQPLTAIQTLSELLLEKGSHTIDQRRGDLELILSAAMRMGRIVSAVRTFGRKVPLDVQEVPARRPLDDALLLLAESLRSARVIVAIDEEPEIPLLLCDAESLQQVFINLLSNARDALENVQAGRSRRIEITLRALDGYARITVTDSGPGIPEELVPRIFDPFFSTKEVGRGSGLGLSISHGIVSEHGGTLDYARGKNGGASFILDLPTKPPAESIVPPTEPSPT